MIKVNISHLCDFCRKVNFLKIITILVAADSEYSLLKQHVVYFGRFLLFLCKCSSSK